MNHLLFIDTSTERGAVFYYSLGNLLAIEWLKPGPAQSKELIPAIEKVVQSRKVDLVGVTVGPGSYTGIRVGVSAAQSLAYAWKVPVVAVSSLTGYAPFEKEPWFATVFDAKIGGVYFQKANFVEGGYLFEKEPSLLPIEEAIFELGDCGVLVSPKTETLEERMSAFGKWKWEEKAADPHLFSLEVKRKIEEGALFYPPDVLPIYYLKETQAERERRSY